MSSSSISNQNSNRAELASQYKIQQNQKEELAASHESEMNNLKKSYSSEKADLEDRFESSIQSEKASHYDHLRNLKQQHTREDRQTEGSTRQAIEQTENNLRREATQSEQDGKARVNKVLQKYASVEELERNRSLAAETEMRTGHRKSAEQILSDSEKRISNLADEKTDYLEHQKENHVATLGDIEEHYQGSRNQIEKQYLDETQSLKSRVDQELSTKRMATAQTMGTFRKKSEDPFYQIKRFDSELTEASDSFILRVKVPEYERKHFKVQVSGQELQILGTRSSDEKVEVEPGRLISTRSFQNISEHFTLGAPVDSRALIYKEDGEWLEYTVPKFGPNHHLGDSAKSRLAPDEDPSMIKELNFKDTLPKPKSPKVPV